MSSHSQVYLKSGFWKLGRLIKNRVCARACVCKYRVNKLKLKKYVSQPKPKHTFTDTDVERVMELGYVKPVAVYALDACNGDVNKACDMLLECG